MRVHQVHRIVWSADAVVLAGVLAAGAQLWWVTEHPAAREQASWSARGAGPSRPPLDVAGQIAIICGPINGPLPAKPRAAPPPLDPVSDFRKRLKYLGALDLPGRAELSIARVSFDGRVVSLVPGDAVGGFQLVEIAVDAESGRARLGFRQDATGDYVAVAPPARSIASLVDVSEEPISTSPRRDIGTCEGAHPPPPASRAFLDRRAGEWVIPEDERRWIETIGEKHVWLRIVTRPDTGATGVSHGLCILALPENDLPFAAPHGIAAGDVIRSINGVAIACREDVVNYLRGDGRTLTRYEVVVDRAGETTQVVYRVPRRGR